MNERVWEDSKAQHPRRHSEQYVQEASEDSVALDGFGKTRKQAQHDSRREVENCRRDQLQKSFKKELRDRAQYRPKQLIHVASIGTGTTPVDKRRLRLPPGWQGQ